ncbi:MAG: CoA ester lyase [Chloroflexi bacterium]|nr:CoA ester lyase [Chloroflexota bacterium]
MTRLRRALLFMPGDDRRKIEKGIAAQPDSVIMDLEDGVALNRKAEARVVIAAALTELDFGSVERVVRINPIGSGLEADDLTIALPARPEAIMLPKAESAEQIDWLHRQTDLPLLLMIETAKGLINLKEIAAVPGVAALCFGADDYTASVGGARTRDRDSANLLYARSAIAAYAAAFDLQAIDTPFVNLQNEAWLRDETRAIVELGYSGKLAIHPKQIAPILEAFCPSPEEVERARRLVQAHEEHQAKGAGAFAFEGRMVDMPVIRAAHNVLARAGINH